ncbi:MAG: [FeFe] hydrogenase H-cluster radical SAM maturase HydE [Phycisphaerae bacterium]|nr:[FeFe] hydrogenase H-cluster radical SAM maturase HydE [Phycisphaerae bacterium]
MQSVLERVYSDTSPDRGDIEYLLGLQSPDDLQQLFAFADKVRAEFCGDGILLRGLVEFSNYCRNACLYCGLNKQNAGLERYRLTHEEVMDAVKRIAEQNIRTVVLQSGEDDFLEARWLEAIITEIKRNFDMAITLSVGECTADEYKLWKQAGADRYLLKIETTDEALYRSLHPNMSFRNRRDCLTALRALGYQVGCGNLVGVKGQTLRSLADDILFFKQQDFDMIGIGLFIPHEATPLRSDPPGDLNLTLKVLAITRIVTRNAHLPATTAVGSIGEYDARITALQAGANVIMPNFTPQPYKKLYEIYPGKRCIDEAASHCVGCIGAKVKAINRSISSARGDSLKKKHVWAC